MMTLVSADGTPLPPGSSVEVEGQAEQFPVAMDGSVYITGLTAENRLRAKWAGAVCGVTVPFKESDESAAQLGEIRMQGRTAMNHRGSLARRRAASYLLGLVVCAAPLLANATVTCSISALSSVAFGIYNPFSGDRAR